MKAYKHLGVKNVGNLMQILIDVHWCITFCFLLHQVQYIIVDFLILPFLSFFMIYIWYKIHSKRNNCFKWINNIWLPLVTWNVIIILQIFFLIYIYILLLLFSEHVKSNRERYFAISKKSFCSNLFIYINDIRS